VTQLEAVEYQLYKLWIEMEDTYSKMCDLRTRLEKSISTLRKLEEKIVAKAKAEAVVDDMPF